MINEAPASPTSDSFRHRLYQTFESGFDTPRSRLMNGGIVGLILINVAAVIMESDPQLYESYGPVFWAIEILSVGVFTIEYLFRLWSCVEASPHDGQSQLSARLKYMRSPMALIDLIAIAPFYLSLIFAFDLRYLRLLRLLRLLKLTHYFHGLDLFLDVLRSENRTILSAVLTVLMLIVIVACLMFSFEHDAQPEDFGTILQAIWWSVVTLTTVGYGDVTPITFGGKVLAIFIMLLGVGLVALPAGILAAKFSEELRARRNRLAIHISSALEDGIIEEHEHEELNQLSEELRLPEGALEHMLAEKVSAASDIVMCPHCQKAIEVKIRKL
jgi:voltage-gated potassium channel